MKLSIAILAVIAVSCVVAAPVAVKSLKPAPQMRLAQRLQAGHKKIQAMSHASKMIQHLAVIRNHLKAGAAKLHQKQISKHFETAYKSVKEQTVILANQYGYLASARVEAGKTILGGTFQAGSSERFTIVYLDSGRVAIRTPQGSYLTTSAGGDRVKLTAEPQIEQNGTYELLTNSDGSYTFKSVHGNYISVTNNDDVVVLQAANGIAQCESFNFVDSSKHTTIQTVTLRNQRDYYLSAPVGSLGGALTAGDSERINLLTVESGFVALRTPQGAYVITKGSGESAQVVAEDKLRMFGLYRLIKNSDGTVSFKSVFHGNYLRIAKSSGKLILDTQTYNDANEKYVVDELFPAYWEQPVALKTHHKTFVSATVQGDVTTISQRAQIGATEQFTLLHLNNGKVLIRTPQGAYLITVSSAAFSKVTTQANIQESIALDQIINTDGTISFKFPQGTYLRANEGGEGAVVNTQTYKDDWEKYTLVDYDGNAVAAV